MKHRLTLLCKKAVRKTVYFFYKLYTDNLQQSIPIYDLQTIDVIRQLSTDAICIDVGVNEGQILDYLYSHCKRGKTLAIEPIPQLARNLRKGYAPSRVMVEEVAVSDQPQRSRFYYFPSRHGISGLRFRETYHNNTQACVEIEVIVQRLDDIFKEDRLDFIKIDVEGAEYNVLKGAERLIRTFRPIIVFESGPGGLEFFGHTPAELFELLQQNTYKVSTLKQYLQNKPSFSSEEFVNNFVKGYDYQYIAY